MAPNEIIASYVPNSRYLEVTVIDRDKPKCCQSRYLTLDATAETYNPALHRDSITWNFEYEGTKYRIQVQRTDADE